MMARIKSFGGLFKLLFWLWVAGYLYYALAGLFIQPQRPNQKTDAIVVLTGGKGRVHEGLELFAYDKAQTLYITGVHPDVKRSEIREMWDGDRLLPNCCIILGYEARTTQQNATETKAWLAKQDYNSIRLVTGNFHMKRALQEFKHAMPDVKIYAHPIEQTDFQANQGRYWTMSFSEYNKALYRWFSLSFEQFLPSSVTNLQLNPQDPSKYTPGPF